MDEEGTTRLKGRLRLSDLSPQAKHPVLLSSKHPLVILLLRHADEDTHHDGPEYVRSILQQESWVLGSRNALRSIKHNCVKFRKVAAQPIQRKTAHLPKERVDGCWFPFQITGMDYFGPLEVKILRKATKYCCCLLTCLTIRAVHIEVFEGLDTDACMMAVTRFMARRGKPHKSVSDNGTNFVGAAREFREIANQWNQTLIHQSLAQQSIVWKFNSLGAPHFGGVWERRVRNCKKALYSILGTRSLTLQMLTTTMCLVEQALNARPVTSVSDDPYNLEGLTPNHFLIGPRFIAQPLLPEASRQVDVAESYIKMLWQRWTK